MNNDNNHNEELMSTSQQPEQAETPVDTQNWPVWVLKRIARARDFHAEVPYTKIQDPLAVLWLADELATLTTEYDRLAAQSAAERRRTAKAEERIVTLTNEKNRVRTTLNFFRSVIKSGESWTATCQREYNAAMEDGTPATDTTECDVIPGTDIDVLERDAPRAYDAAMEDGK